jgi:glycosyltransferase involved in cell wall biosynthesis
MPTISVLINCFNYRGFVVEAVESALRQSRPPDQIVVVDDGSTDGSGAVLTEKFSNVANVEIVLQRNRGQLAAIAAAFQRATGDLIFLLDADDRYQPDHLERVASVYEARKDVDFIFTGMMEFGDRAERRLFLPKDHYFASSVIRSLHAAEWIGEATSALSCRRWVMEAMLPVFLELAPQWKIRADDCVLRGSSTVGARKLFLAVTTVDYRVHGSNSFANRALDLAHHRQHFVRTLCFINRMNRHVGLEPDMIGRAHLEFELIPEPRRRDFDSYWALVKSSSLVSWAAKFRMWWHMRRHFARCGQKD